MHTTGLKRPIGLAALSALSVLSALLALPFEAGAAAPWDQLPELATYAKPDRAQVIEAGARKEGKVLIYTGASGTVVEDFRKKYPWLTVEVVQSDAPGHVRRISQEYGAGRYLVDSVSTSNGGLYLLKELGHLQSFSLPSRADYRKEAVEPNGYWMQSFQDSVSSAFNTTMVSPAEAPGTFDALLNPKWRGKIGIAQTSLVNWIGVVVGERGDKAEDYLRRLSEQKLQVYPLSGRALANLLVSGEVALTPAAFSSHIFSSKKQGAKVEWRPFEGVYGNQTSIAIPKYTPHPHAALLYTDFVTSHEGQLLHQALGYASGRSDLVNQEDLAGEKQTFRRHYLGEDPDYVANYEKWQALGRKIFGAGGPEAGPP